MNHYLKMVILAALLLCLGAFESSILARALTFTNPTVPRLYYQYSSQGVTLDASVVLDSDSVLIDKVTVTLVSGSQSEDTLTVDTTVAAANGITFSQTDTNPPEWTLQDTTNSQTDANFQAVMRTLKFSSSYLGQNTQERRAEFIIFEQGSVFEVGGEPHFYELVSSAGVTWLAANTDAGTRDYYGLQGYLVTVTSAGENTFIQNKLSGAQGWMGASDSQIPPTAPTTEPGNPAAEGTWYWVTGPEAGTLLNSGYTNWNGGEPNDAGGEDFLHMLSGGLWNDFRYNNGSISGYVVEYGGLNDVNAQLIIQFIGHKSTLQGQNF